MDCAAEFSTRTGFDRLQAFMQAHPAWPALDWLKKRSEESSSAIAKATPLLKPISAAWTPRPRRASLLSRAL